ncbi:MAG: RluA family pseudouridine synthase [Pseudomonadales bacterium]|nr:RluA family pseudouridine synthase [Pseudomonadales bacterium]
MQIRHIEVSEASSGQRVDNFLLRELRQVPRSHVYRILRKGEVRVNGKRSKPTQRLVIGDVVRIPVEDADDRQKGHAVPTRILKQLETCILYEDRDLLGMNKPSGLAVHGGSGLSFGLIECVRKMYPECDKLELAHRLDRETSGCLLIAKNRKTLVRLHDMFRRRKVRKDYELLVHGRWKKNDRSVRHSLFKYTTKSGERRVRLDTEGKSARTDFFIVKQSPQFTWLKAQPHTGRTHQIRVHALACGAPIVGDEKYAGDSQLALSQQRGVRRLCLHASRLELPAFVEPEENTQDCSGSDTKNFIIQAPPPSDFTLAWQKMTN